MKGADRHQRLADAILRVVAEALQHEVKDFDLSMVTVIRCDLARDCSEATIRYSVLGDEKKRADCAAHLAKVASFLQRRVAEAVSVYRTPHLRFRYDAGIEDSIKLESLFDQIARERRPDE
jgi:ribosome-binding factor A